MKSLPVLTLETLRDPGTVIKNPPVGMNQDYVYRIEQTGDTFEVAPQKKDLFLKRFELMQGLVEDFTNIELEKFRQVFK